MAMDEEREEQRGDQAGAGMGASTGDIGEEGAGDLGSVPGPSELTGDAETWSALSDEPSPRDDESTE
jgi:hypothetical protein